MLAPMSRKTASGYLSMVSITAVTSSSSQTPDLRIHPDTYWSTLGFFTQIVVLIPA